MKPRILSAVRLSIPLASAIATLGAMSHTQAQSTWNQTVAGTTYSWQTGTNWTPNGAPSGTSVTASLNNNIAGAQTISLNGAVTLGILNLGDSDNSHAFTLAAGTGGSLTFNNGGSGAQINEAGATGDSISTGITLADNLTVTTAGSLTLSGLIGQSGTRSLIKDGAGTLVLSNNSNSFSGGLTIKNGIVNVGATGNAVGTGALAMGGSGSSGATLIGNATVARALTVNAPTSGVVTLAPNTLGNSLTYSGAITLNGDLTVRAFFASTSVGTGNTTVSGGITGTGNLILSNTGNGAGVTGATSKIVVSTTAINHTGSITARGDNTGAGALTTISANIGSNVTSFTKEGVVKVILSGNNSFTGGVTISGGTLELGSTGALNSTAGSQNAVAFSSGSTGILALNGNSVTIGNLSTHATPGTTFVQNGHASTATTLTVGNSQNLSGTYAGIIRNGAAGTLALTKAGAGTLTLSGKNTFTGNVNITGGTLVANVAATGANTALGNSVNTRTVTVGSGANLNFNVANVLSTTFSSSALPSLLISGTATNNVAGNNALGNVTLTGGTLTATNGHADYGAFNLNGTVTSTGTSTISASGGAKMMLTSTGANFVETASTFDVQSGTLTVSADLSEVTTESKISGLTKIGAGTLVLSGANTYTGATTVTAGILRPTLASTIAGYTTPDKVVFDGGMIATTMGDGSSTGWSTAQVDSLLANATRDSGSLGIDTTNGDVTQWTDFTSSNFGPLNLVKLGANTLTLNSINTFTGNTTIAGGTLRLADVNALQGSALVAINSGSTVGILELATDTSVFASNITGGSSAQGTIVSDRATAGAGLTHVLGTANFGINTFNFTSGTNVTSGTGGISFASVNLGGGASGTTVLNPTSANLTIETVTASNATPKTLGLGGTSTGNFITGAISDGAGPVVVNLTKSNSSTWTLSGLSTTPASNYSGTTIIDQGTLALTTDASLTGGLTFGSAASNTTEGTLDLTSASATFAGAMAVNTNSATASEIKIGSAQTLTINNNVQIGATTPTTGLNTVTKLNLTGGGVFNVATAAGGFFRVGGSTLTSTTTSQDTTLDLTALSATTIDASATGTIRVNAASSSNVAGYKSTLLLPTPAVADTAATSTLTAGTISVGSSSGFNSAAGQINTLRLGTGLTTLNADTLNVGTGSRDIGQIIFGQASGDLKIRAADGSSRATTFNVGAGGGGTGTSEPSTNNLVDFSGHDSDILVTSLNVGNQPRTGALTSEFKFGAGDASLASTLDATNVNIGFRTGTATASNTLTNRVNLTGGTVTFGNISATGNGVDIGNSTYSGAGAAGTIGELNISGGNVTIHNGVSGFAVRLGSNVVAGGGTVTASMNLTGGTATLGGDIIRGATAPRTTSSLALNGASAILDMGGNDITNLTDITYTDGTLKNLGVVNTGMILAGTGSRVFDQGVGVLGDIQGEIAGSGLGLTKQGDGTLTLSGTNSYNGATSVSDGTLVVNGSISTSILTTVDVGATLAGSGTVGAAIINGTLSVGNSPGQMDFTNTLTLAGNTVMEIDGTAGVGVTGGHDFVNLTGTGVDGVLTYGGTMTLDMGMIFNPGSYSWNLFDMASNTATFATISLGDQYSGSLLDGDSNGVWDLTAANGFGDNNIWTFTGSTGVLALNVIPEPSAALLGGLGLLALLRRRRN